MSRPAASSPNRPGGGSGALRPTPSTAGLAAALRAGGTQRRRRQVVSPLMKAPALLTVLVVNAPLLYLLVRSLQQGWSVYAETVFTVSTLLLVWRTLALVVGVLAIALVIATWAAWLVTRTDLPGRRIWAVLAALPLAFPSYIAAFTLVIMLGPRGFVQGWLETLGITRIPDLAYGYTGALLALAFFTYPYIYLLAASAFRNLDPSLEEISQSLGFGRWATFFRVILPQLRPSLLAGSLLVVLYTLSDFGAVSILRYDTFTLSIYNAYRARFDLTAAASLSTVLVLLTVLFIALEVVLLRGVRPTRSRPARRRSPQALGPWRWPSVAGMALLSLLTLGIPIGVIGYWCVVALRVGNPLGSAWKAAGGSLGVSVLAAFVCVVLAVPIAAWSVREPTRLARFVERSSYAGYALPGIVVALALVFLGIRLARPLYQTLAMLILAYVVRFLPEALAACRSSLAVISPTFEEAGRSLGRSTLGVFNSLTVPMMRSGLMAGAGLVFLTTMKELPATLILRPIGFETLATRIWSAASEGIYSEVGIPALVLLAASLFPVYWFVIRPVFATR